MELQRLKQTWDSLGRRDALGVILSYPLRVDDWRVEEFFETGKREIDEVLELGRRFGLPAQRRTALDFGCGVGRLTQALCAHFERCDGVDIAPSMLELAEQLNRHGDRCRYHLNDSPSLERFDSDEFDLVYSNITLQHIEPRYSRRYIAELVRVLAPGGLLVFQLPSKREQPRDVPGDAKLPRNAVLAEITPADERLTVEPGASVPFRARVRNVGAAPWPARPGHGQVALGNHWLDADGRMLRRDDGRAPLPTLAPGQETEVVVEVTAPAQAGDYLLELDVVQEGIAWFSERRRLSRRRSQTARLPVRVVAGANTPDGTAATSEPTMDMYGIPRAEVLDLLAASGARVLDVAENDAAGPGWISLRYAATKDG